MTHHRPPHPATLAHKKNLPPHPATVVQPRARPPIPPAGLAPVRAPHPATVDRPPARGRIVQRARTQPWELRPVTFRTGPFTQDDDNLFSYLRENELFAQVVVDALQLNGPITVNSSHPAPGEALGEWQRYERTVLVSERISRRAERMQVLIFEFCNACATYDDIDRGEQQVMGLALSGQDLDEALVDDLAMAMERKESQTVERYTEVVRYGITALGWPRELDIYRGLFSGRYVDWHRYREAAQRTGHTDILRGSVRAVYAHWRSRAPASQTTPRGVWVDGVYHEPYIPQ